ncbi:hypothetical protein N7457_000758 [Penicillium paradoxum]|uniref:uncharacterized protein n=1 Tax=Penicillium paradoxum TaxID=176176 RepID=UPI00254717FE|nr:uncharacterized protein N7457_000758 [Penicillium paradoxum]KAJ5794159.1 hypothetical protein N7457_000758 [Penicillium paradoxum]
MSYVDNQKTQVPQSIFLGVIWALTGTSLLFILVRIYAQFTSFRRLFIDDFLVILAWIMFFTSAVIWQIEGKVLEELNAISAGTKPFKLGFLPRYLKFRRFIAPFEILFYSALWCVKFSFLALFYRISAKVKTFRTWWFVVLFCTASVYIASVADIEYKCSWGELEYIWNECPQLNHIHYENRTFWANCAGDVITDLMMLWNTRISRRKKLLLLSIFSATILIMVTAIIRVAIGANYDRRVNINWLFFWSFVEVAIAIFVSCVASLRQLFVTSQNQSPSTKPAYQNTYDPLFKRSKEACSEDMSYMVEDLELRTNDRVPMSPLNIIHVFQDYHVTSVDASQPDEKKISKGL